MAIAIRQARDDELEALIPILLLAFLEQLLDG